MEHEGRQVVDYVALGERFRAARKARHMTQQEVADVVGVSLSYVGHMERGIKHCTLDTLVEMSYALDVSVEHLLFGKSILDSRRKIALDHLEAAVRVLQMME